MFRWNKAKPKKKKTAHVRKEPPKPYTPPDIPKFTKQSEKAKPKEEKRVSPEKAFMDTFRQLTSCHRSIDIWQDFVVMDVRARFQTRWIRRSRIIPSVRNATCGL